ncbi:hypoxia up-regulated protein 1-like isoform X3 [Penaeus japonicus]|uniref:hypoxia up-regulated protein 1-like isoform X3 n=1 Tax=Penaeus japonicus TaxID=27405 RepID=UPI001C71269F|nr:hypoxia up-regulated protein 1-like isoform X3 [Penaeus japonicus]
MMVPDIRWTMGLSLLVLLGIVGSSSGVTIMSIDFGSEWIKVAVVAPGVPMEIVLNKESKRKTPGALSFRNGERTLGEDALTTGIRFPANNYFYLLDLLGKKIDNPIVELYKKRFPYYNIEADPERGTVVFRHIDDTTYTVEELIAQMLAYAKDMAMSHTEQRIKDCVITVPPFFNQAERRAMLTAAELAGLKVLSLMSTNAAVALNYGMFRRKEVNATAQNILFYDMGASSTTATIVSYQTVKTKDRGYTETNPQVTVLGLGYDRTLGGLEFQMRLRDYLANKFNEVKKTSNNVLESPRALAKLMKEAGRLKKVLSANTEHLSQIEGLLDEEDFRLHVNREQFEGLCTELFDRVQAPVDAALISAAMDISAIDQFIIVGGATRIPKVQSILLGVWGRELGKNINADEAAAMGAVYRAADLGQGFKVKKFHVKEAVVFPIEVDFERQVESDDGSTSTKVVKRSLFAFGNNYPQKKVMTFNKHTADFNFYVNYGDLSHLSKEELKYAHAENISRVQVSGVTSAFQKHQQEGSEPKGIKAHFNMDDSGVLTLSMMEAVFEKSVLVEEDKPKEEESTLSKLGTEQEREDGEKEENEDAEGKENKTEEDNAEKKEQEGEAKKENKEDKKDDQKTDKKEKEDDEKKSSTDKKKEGEKELKPKQITVKEELNMTITYHDIPDMTEEQVAASKKKLEDINTAERARHEREAARNNLESYILDAQDKLYQEDYEQASTDDQRTAIRELCSTLDEWIYDEGFDVEASVYKEKLKELSKLFEPIKQRVFEHLNRPEAIQALMDMMNKSSEFVQRARVASSEQQFFTDVEIDTMDKLIVDTQKWLEDKEEQQQAQSLSDDPKLKLNDVGEKLGALDREIKYLVNKAKITKAKKDKEAAEAKAKAEKEAKEGSKKKNNTDNSKSAKNKSGGETKSETEEKDKSEKIVTEEEPKIEQNEESSYVFEEESEENNSEEDRRKKDVDIENEEALPRPSWMTPPNPTWSYLSSALVIILIHMLFTHPAGIR